MPVSTMFIYDFRIATTVWYCFAFYSNITIVHFLIHFRGPGWLNELCSWIT
jgi:hypothetical protein